MNLPEFLTIFSNEGNIEVEVKFKDTQSQIVKQRMSPDEIIKLIDYSNNNFYTKMTFDEHLFEVYKYQIDPIKKKFIIMARKIKKSSL